MFRFLKDLSSNTTIWRGTMIWTITELIRLIGIPSSNVAIRTTPVKREVERSISRILDSVSFGDVDLLSLQTGHVPYRHTFVDFTPVTVAMDMNFFSRRVVDDGSSGGGNFLTGIFDWYTYAFTVAAVVAVMLYFIIDLKFTPSSAFVYTMQVPCFYPYPINVKAYKKAFPR